MVVTAAPLPLDAGVAVIGLGKMGLPMARNLAAKGLRVVGHDVAEPARDQAREADLEVVSSPAEAAATTALALVVVGFDDQVLDATTGPGGLLDGARPGYVIAVCATVEPRTVLEVAERAAAGEVHVLDAPICRGEPAAADGTLLVMCGGDDLVLDAADPALRAIGTDIHRLGAVGAGQVGKMLNNFLLWNAVVGNAEALRLGARLGVDVIALREALLQSSGNNWALETWTRSRPMPWAEKDMRILLQHADDVGFPIRLAGLIREEITEIKRQKAAWSEGGGAASSMDAFLRAHP
jgi:3-hydroxyisobutyrate dehydrogenase-like beta-hydroxyacid dehydrogenase